MGLSVTLAVGDRVGKHELREFIGKGGYGEVWLARDVHLDRDYAVKFLDEAGSTIDERLREAKLGTRLNNDHLVKVHYADPVDHGTSKLVAIAMDYHPKKSVVHNLDPGGIVVLPRALKYGVEVLKGVGFLHELDMIHSDVKPTNVLITERGHATLTDYGISCHSPTDDPVPMRGHYGPHVAPEMFSGNIVRQTDIYHMGLTIFRMLNGDKVLHAKKKALGDAAYFDCIKKGKVISKHDWLPIVPQKLRAVILKAVALNPSDRYETALAMQRAIERLSFPGYWTQTTSGDAEGHTQKHVYRYEMISHGGKTFDFTGLCEHRHSGRKNRVVDYCSKGLTKAEAMDIQYRFMQFVVTGKDKT